MRREAVVRHGGSQQVGRQPCCRSCTHCQLLAYVLYRGLQRPRPLRGLVLDGLHRLQQGSDICHHHLWKGEEHQVKLHASSGLLLAPVPPSWFGPKLPCPHTLLTPPHLVLPSMPPLHVVLHLLCAPSSPLALTAPQLSCPQAGREASLLFLQAPCPIPSFPSRPAQTLAEFFSW